MGDAGNDAGDQAQEDARERERWEEFWSQPGAREVVVSVDAERSQTPVVLAVKSGDVVSLALSFAEAHEMYRALGAFLATGTERGSADT